MFHPARAISVVLLSLFAVRLAAQNLVSNPSFEVGVSQPTNWVFNNSFYCVWNGFGKSGSKSLGVTNYNLNCNGMQWRSAAFAVQPGKPYIINVQAVSSNAAEIARLQFGLGTPANVGLSDRFVFPPANWTSFPFATLAPRNQPNLILRLISCGGVGTINMDDAEVLPAEPAHALDVGGQLGWGESVGPGRYQFAPNLRDFGQGYYFGNYARPAYDCTAFFSTFYTWYMAANSQFTYRHDFAGMAFTNAIARVVSSYSLGGSMIIEFSADGTNWIAGTNYSPGVVGYVTYTNVAVAPAALMPATNLFVRTRIDATGFFYASSYTFEADVPTITNKAAGNTLLFGQKLARQFVEVVGLSNNATELVLALRNTNAAPREYAVQWNVLGPAGTRNLLVTNTVAAGVTNLVTLPFAGIGWGENTLTVQVTDLVSGGTNFLGTAVFVENVLRDAGYGQMLPAATNCSVWWCEGTYKVGRSRALPAATNSAAQAAAARNDHEPLQVVLRPEVTLSNATASISSFLAVATNNLFTISSTNVEITLVDYVPVITPTDYTCVAGDHPDPLLPWTSGVNLPAGSNQPVWVTIRVPKDAPAGDYTATLTVQHDAGSIAVPVNLHVWNFTLPDTSHTRASLNVGVDDYWHAMTNSSLRVPTYELYLKNLREHRVSPFKPHNYTGFSYTQVNGTNGISYNFNFAGFDSAMENYYEAYGFNGWRLDGEAVPNSLNGNPRFTAGYRTLYKRFMEPLMAHLRERGWLRAAYSYWIDEPNDTLIQTTVIPGMTAIAEAAPGLTRLETREPKPELYGYVDTWAPYTPWMVMASIPERRAYGENFLWYVSGGPGAPYAMHLLDHPAINVRMRFWMGEKYGIDGEMFWQAAWWIGTVHAPNNPWTNTMTRLFDGSAHGNGNGVFLYPPTKTPPTSPLVAAPINSLRWEIFREGIEDREYFWLLNQCLLRREPVLGVNHPAVIQAKAAREAALGIALSRTYYESDPQKLYAARQAVAEAIETLDDGAPFIVRDPVSRAVALGSNLVLRAEAVGWPRPAYQWQHEGTNVPAATNETLSITSFNSQHLGGWRVVASNAVGSVASAVANLAGYWVQTPQIIAFSLGDNRRAGDRTVLEVTAVSSLPMTYRWYLNGVLLAGVTNNAWAITNLSAGSAGLYTVTASNAAGVALGGPIVLSVMPAYTNQPPSFEGNWAGAAEGFALSLPVDNRLRAVLVSTNLANWSTQFMVNPSGLPQIITDPEATNQARRFYRVRAN